MTAPPYALVCVFRSVRQAVYRLVRAVAPMHVVQPVLGLAPLFVEVIALARVPGIVPALALAGVREIAGCFVGLIAVDLALVVVIPDVIQRVKLRADLDQCIKI